MKDNRVPIKCGTLQPTSNNHPITCIKLEAPGDAGSSSSSAYGFRLVAGYGNGGFSLWNLSVSSMNELHAEEAVIHIPNVRSNSNRSVVSIGISYPMLVLCTASMTLSFFCIDLDSNPATNHLVYELTSPIQWSPIVTDIHKLKNQSDDYWRANVCFGMSVGVNMHTVGIQVKTVLSVIFLVSISGSNNNNLPYYLQGIHPFSPQNHFITAFYSFQRKRHVF